MSDLEPGPTHTPRVGDICTVTRYSIVGRVDHVCQRTIVRVTPKRAYFDHGDWFALADRIVKPKYIDYTTRVTAVENAAVVAEKEQSNG